MAVATDKGKLVAQQVVKRGLPVSLRSEQAVELLLGKQQERAGEHGHREDGEQEDGALLAEEDGENVHSRDPARARSHHERAVAEPEHEHGRYAPLVDHEGQDAPQHELEHDRQDGHELGPHQVRHAHDGTERDEGHHAHHDGGIDPPEVEPLPLHADGRRGKAEGHRDAQKHDHPRSVERHIDRRSFDAQGAQGGHHEREDERHGDELPERPRQACMVFGKRRLPLVPASVGGGQRDRRRREQRHARKRQDARERRAARDGLPRRRADDREVNEGERHMGKSRVEDGGARRQGAVQQAAAKPDRRRSQSGGRAAQVEQRQHGGVGELMVEVVRPDKDDGHAPERGERPSSDDRSRALDEPVRAARPHRRKREGGAEGDGGHHVHDGYIGAVRFGVRQPGGSAVSDVGPGQPHAERQIRQGRARFDELARERTHGSGKSPPPVVRVPAQSAARARRSSAHRSVRSAKYPRNTTEYTATLATAASFPRTAEGPSISSRCA